MNPKFPFAPDDEPGPGHLVLDGKLGIPSALDFNLRPPALPQAGRLSFSRASDADSGVKVRFGTRFEEQWDDHYRKRTIFLPPPADLLLPRLENAGMQNGLQLTPRPGVAKYQIRQSLAAKLSASINQPGPEGGGYFLKGWLSWFNQIAGQVVGVNHRDPPLDKQSGARGFSHPNAPGQTVAIH